MIQKHELETRRIEFYAKCLEETIDAAMITASPRQKMFTIDIFPFSDEVVQIVKEKFEKESKWKIEIHNDSFDRVLIIS